MSWSRRYIRTSEVRPYDKVLHCGICGIEVHVTRANGVLPANVYGLDAEDACESHLAEHHPLRLWLWKKLGWGWLIGGLAR